MRVLLLPDSLFKYVLFIFEQHLRAGIPSDEVFAAADLKAALGKAQTVDFSKLGKAEIEKMTPTGIALNLAPEQGQKEAPPARTPLGDSLIPDGGAPPEDDEPGFNPR